MYTALWAKKTGCAKNHTCFSVVKFKKKSARVHVCELWGVQLFAHCSSQFDATLFSNHHLAEEYEDHIYEYFQVITYPLLYSTVFCYDKSNKRQLYKRLHKSSMLCNCKLVLKGPFTALLSPAGCARLFKISNCWTSLLHPDSFHSTNMETITYSSNNKNSYYISG